MSLYSSFLLPVLSDASLADYFSQSNFAGKMIVIILLVFSVLAWGVMFCKYADLSAVEKLNAQTARALKTASLTDAASDKSLDGPYARILRDAVNAWLRAGVGNSAGDRTARIAHVENTIERTLARQIMYYNTKMTLLGTIISGAPFLGLLGTAWGVMDCFGSMSAQTSVTLQMLAPGVAGALLTTVAGLVVAIPSVFGYNFLTAKSTELSTQTENFASLVADEIEMESRAIAARSDASLERASAAASTRPAPAREEPKFATSTAPASPRKNDIAEFSFDDDSDSPTPPRQFDE